MEIDLHRSCGTSQNGWVPRSFLTAGDFPIGSRKGTWHPPALPLGYQYVAWSPNRLKDHAEAKHLSFQEEIDAEVFDCLAKEEGCRRLMQEISEKPGFLPEATWLIECTLGTGAPEPCGTIQGIRTTTRYGSIQNVGVTPWHRGRGLGRALVRAALFGFQSLGLERACLEVTSENVAAVRMYESLGFRRTKTLYKAVDWVAS